MMVGIMFASTSLTPLWINQTIFSLAVAASDKERSVLGEIVVDKKNQKPYHKV